MLQSQSNKLHTAVTADAVAVAAATHLYMKEVYLLRMVMPLSLSMLLLSMARSTVRVVPHWDSSRSISVVLPWSMWAVR